MGLRYLDGKSWAQVTREERVFCQHLYVRVLERGVHAFVEYLNAWAGLGADTSAVWELAYEVCFYRDLWHHRNRNGDLFSRKRTFDLCLLSDEHIIVIEAKAQQSFDEEQVGVFVRDREQVKRETGVTHVSLVGLASSQCTVPDAIQKSFDGPIVTWKDLSAYFDGDPLLQRGDDVYEKPVFASGKNNVGKMTGQEIVEAHALGRRFLVGRDGGMTGKRFTADLTNQGWRRQKYETNDAAVAAPNPNWFSSEEFVAKVLK